MHACVYARVCVCNVLHVYVYTLWEPLQELLSLRCGTALTPRSPLTSSVATHPFPHTHTPHPSLWYSFRALQQVDGCGTTADLPRDGPIVPFASTSVVPSRDHPPGAFADKVRLAKEKFKVRDIDSSPRVFHA